MEKLNTEKVIILSTRSEIAEGLIMFLAGYIPANDKPSFEDDKINVAKASKFADVSYATMCKWIQQGKIKVYGKGRTRFILKSELIQSLTK